MFKKDAVPFVEALAEDAYDVALADPPYRSGIADRVVRRWLDLPFAHVLVIEHAVEQTLPGWGRFHPAGDSALTVYRVRDHNV